MILKHRLDEEEVVFEVVGLKRIGCFLDNLFLFALVWSIGGNMSLSTYNSKFDVFLRQLLAGEVSAAYKPYMVGSHRKIFPVFPNTAEVYHFVWNGDMLNWGMFRELLPKYKIPNDAAFSSIFVPTAETVSFKFILATLIQYQVPTLLVGSTGTAKSRLMKVCDQQWFQLFSAASLQIAEAVNPVLCTCNQAF